MPKARGKTPTHLLCVQKGIAQRGDVAYNEEMWPATFFFFITLEPRAE
jgi:hypothetical protein